MKAHQIDLVRDSFVQILFASSEATTLFYARLFELAPETHRLFQGDMDEQGRRLIEALAKIVTGLSRLDAMLPDIQALAVRHVHYGVEERHYAIVGAALLDMIAQVCGDKYDEATDLAWREAYGLLAGAMIAAARLEIAQGAAPVRPRSGPAATAESPARRGRRVHPNHSHSIVPGGLLV